MISGIVKSQRGIMLTVTITFEHSSSKMLNEDSFSWHNGFIEGSICLKYYSQVWKYDMLYTSDVITPLRMSIPFCQSERVLASSGDLKRPDVAYQGSQEGISALKASSSQGKSIVEIALKSILSRIGFFAIFTLCSLMESTSWDKMFCIRLRFSWRKCS